MKYLIYSDKNIYVFAQCDVLKYLCFCRTLFEKKIENNNHIRQRMAESLLSGIKDFCINPRLTPI